jgi:hypothetical protein
MRNSTLSINSQLGFIITCAAVLVMSACSINVKKNENGEDKKVDIETPVGGLHVSKNADVRDVGLPVYPGARLKQKDSDGDEKSANVNISSGFFGLKVVALEYESDDPPEKLITFYTDQLKKYGRVLECHSRNTHDDVEMNRNHSRDSKELKCDGDNKGNKVELKAGTEDNQHIVAVQPADKGKGSTFALVYVQTRGKDKDTI